MQILTENEYEILEHNYKLMLTTLQTIVDTHDCASELFTNDKDLADNLKDWSAKALKEMKPLTESLF